MILNLDFWSENHYCKVLQLHLPTNPKALLAQNQTVVMTQ